LPHLIRSKAKGGDMGYVINRDGKPIANLKKGFAAAVRRAGLADITPHTLKHTAISWRLDARVSIWDVSKLFATSVKTIEKTYGHISPEAMQNAADSMVRNGAQKGAQRGSIRPNWAKSA
jgi:integrase